MPNSQPQKTAYEDAVRGGSLLSTPCKYWGSQLDFQGRASSIFQSLHSDFLIFMVLAEFLLDGEKKMHCNEFTEIFVSPYVVQTDSVYLQY